MQEECLMSAWLSDVSALYLGPVNKIIIHTVKYETMIRKLQEDFFNQTQPKKEENSCITNQTTRV